MRLYDPYEDHVISQTFGQNATSIYASWGLKGHTSIDYVVSFGAPIPNCVENAYCYSTLNKDNPDPTKYRAVFTLVEDETGIYEISYGHCNEMYAEVGKTYGVGDIIATVGNKGDVFYNGVAVTKEARLAGSHAGAHLHGPQIRILEKESAKLNLTPGRQYIYDGNGILYKDGYRYYAKDYDNGYNGCVDPSFFRTHMFARDYKKTVSYYQSLVQILISMLSLLSKKGA